jgi:hypothetical protein
MWRIRFWKNWGTRLPRFPYDFFVDRKPTDDEVIRILNLNGIKATKDWLSSAASGLVVVSQVKVEKL